jgi:hypothetical protein
MDKFKTCALLGYNAGYSGNSLPTYRDTLSVGPIFKGQESKKARKDKFLYSDTWQVPLSGVKNSTVFRNGWFI